jgi:hypothetical protein
VHHAINRWTIDVVDRVMEFEVVDRGGQGDPLLHTRGFVRPTARWDRANDPTAVEA